MCVSHSGDYAARLFGRLPAAALQDVGRGGTIEAAGGIWPAWNGAQTWVTALLGENESVAAVLLLQLALLCAPASSPSLN